MLNLLKGYAKTKMVTETLRHGSGNYSRGLPCLSGDACPVDCRVCRNVCPTGAFCRTGVDPKACISCRLCIGACPQQSITCTDVPIIKNPGHFDETERQKVRQICRKSLHIRYVDAGACNACDFEINSLTNPIYDIQQYGVDFVASPRHADMLLVTGVVTRNLEIAVLKTYEACPQPVLVVAVGTCACGGGIFKDAYAAGGGVDKYLPVDVYVPGCPPSPALIAQGILAAIERY